MLQIKCFKDVLFPKSLIPNLGGDGLDGVDVLDAPLIPAQGVVA